MTPPRPPTHHGPRNEERTRTPGRGVPVETLPPPRSRAASFDFEGATPPAMDPSTYHALQKLREEMKESDIAIQATVKDLDVKVGRIGEGHAEMTGKVDTLVDLASRSEAARERAAERRWRYGAAIITALGVAIAGIIVALAKGAS